MRRIIFTAGAAAAAAAVVSGALAGGGNSIANAPELPIGQQQFNGKDGADFWRVTLGAGDFLRIDFGSTGRNNYTSVCLLRPDVTDYTLREARCLAYERTTTKAQLRFVANPGGRWLVVVSPDYGTGEGCVRSPRSCPIAYELTAHRALYTSTVVSAPRLARSGQSITLRGQVRGAAGGQVEIRARPAGKRWQTLGTARLSPAGAFAKSIRVFTRGTTLFRVIYHGDAGHRASSRTVAVRVV